MSDMVELALRQEARFALWSFRCGVASAAGCPMADATLRRAFDVAGIGSASAEFWRLCQVLCVLAESQVEWHQPDCECVSRGEMALLHALAGTSERLALDVAEPDPWWGVVVPAVAVRGTDRLAREWLGALGRAGVRYPAPAGLAMRWSEVPHAAPEMRARLQ